MAEALTTRYNNVTVSVSVILINTLRMRYFALLLSDHDNVMPIIIGCVDNNKTRQVLTKYLSELTTHLPDRGNTVRNTAGGKHSDILEDWASKKEEYVPMRTPHPSMLANIAGSIVFFICTHCLNL